MNPSSKLYHRRAGRLVQHIEYRQAFATALKQRYEQQQQQQPKQVQAEVLESESPTPQQPPKRQGNQRVEVRRDELQALQDDKSARIAFVIFSSGLAIALIITCTGLALSSVIKSFQPAQPDLWFRTEQLSK